VLPRFDDLERGDLLTACASMGYAAPAGMGGWMPLPWAELEAFGRCTGRISTPWEHETVRAMSMAYVSGLVEGRDLFSVVPIERD